MTLIFLIKFFSMADSDLYFYVKSLSLVKNVLKVLIVRVFVSLDGCFYFQGNDKLFKRS